MNLSFVGTLVNLKQCLSSYWQRLGVPGGQSPPFLFPQFLTLSQLRGESLLQHLLPSGRVMEEKGDKPCRDLAGDSELGNSPPFDFLSRHQG